jgi:hypothetical protein
MLAGLIRTGTGSYDSAFILSGVLCLIAAVMVLFAGRAAPFTAAAVTA